MTSRAAHYFPSPSDWRDIPIYQVFTDRFADGDPAKNELTPGVKCDRFVARLRQIRAEHPALRQGDQTVVADDAGGPGIYAFIRRRGREAVLVILNAAAAECGPHAAADGIHARAWERTCLPPGRIGPLDGGDCSREKRLAPGEGTAPAMTDGSSNSRLVFLDTFAY